MRGRNRIIGSRVSGSGCNKDPRFFYGWWIVVVLPVTLIVGGIGAPAAGYVYDITGPYDNIWWVGVGIMSAAAILEITVKAPNHPSQRLEQPWLG